MNKESIKRTAAGAALCLCLGLAAFAGWRLIDALRIYREGETAYSGLARLAPIPAEEQKGILALPSVDYDALSGINPGFKGWLYIPDTAVSYPVAQGEDNDYYLNHMFDGTENKAGCLFLDFRCGGFGDRHSIIYGHNMKNDTMLTPLTLYEDPAFYASHPRAYLLTPQATYEISFFAGYTASVSEPAWELGFPDDESFRTWCAQRKQRSVFTAPDAPEGAGRVLTLSTCARNFEDTRFVLHGWLTEANPEATGEAAR